MRSPPRSFRHQHYAFSIGVKGNKLGNVNCDTDDQQSRIACTHAAPSLYIWAKIPEGQSSADFAGRLIEEQGVVVTPGNGYGPSGEGYIRLSLTLPDNEVDEGVERIAAFTGG